MIFIVDVVAVRHLTDQEEVVFLVDLVDGDGGCNGGEEEEEEEEEEGAASHWGSQGRSG